MRKSPAQGDSPGFIKRTQPQRGGTRRNVSAFPACAPFQAHSRGGRPRLATSAPWVLADSTAGSIFNQTRSCRLAVRVPRPHDPAGKNEFVAAPSQNPRSCLPYLSVAESRLPTENPRYSFHSSPQASYPAPVEDPPHGSIAHLTAADTSLPRTASLPPFPFPSTIDRKIVHLPNSPLPRDIPARGLLPRHQHGIWSTRHEPCSLSRRPRNPAPVCLKC